MSPSCLSAKASFAASCAASFTASKSRVQMALLLETARPRVGLGLLVRPGEARPAGAHETREEAGNLSRLARVRVGGRARATVGACASARAIARARARAWARARARVRGSALAVLAARAPLHGHHARRRPPHLRCVWGRGAEGELVWPVQRRTHAVAREHSRGSARARRRARRRRRRRGVSSRVVGSHAAEAHRDC